MNKSVNTYRDITQRATVNDHCLSLVSNGGRSNEEQGWALPHTANVHTYALNTAPAESSTIQGWLERHCEMWEVRKIRNQIRLQ